MSKPLREKRFCLECMRGRGPETHSDEDWWCVEVKDLRSAVEELKKELKNVSRRVWIACVECDGEYKGQLVKACYRSGEKCNCYCHAPRISIDLERTIEKIDSYLKCWDDTTDKEDDGK